MLDRSSKLAILLVLVACHHAPAPDAGETRAEAVAAKVVGKPAPALTVTTVDGQTIDLVTLYGQKPVYLKFWATWCIPCNEQMPRFEHLYETLGDRVAVIAVDAGLDDDPSAVRAFRDSHGMKMPVVVDDGRLADALALEVTPQHVIIGRDGRVAFVGHQDGDKLEAALERALAEKPGEVVRQAVALRPTIHAGENAALLLGPSSHRRAIVMFATWCEDYLKERQPKSAQTCERVRGEVDALRAAHPDIEFSGVASGVWTSPEDIAPYREQTRTTLPITLDRDGALFRAFDVHALGTVVLVDADGVVKRIVRPSDDLRAAVAAFL